MVFYGFAVPKIITESSNSNSGECIVLSGGQHHGDEDVAPGNESIDNAKRNCDGQDSLRPDSGTEKQSYQSLADAQARIHASDLIRSLDQVTSLGERCDLIEEFELRFVITRTGDAERYKNIIRDCEMIVGEVFVSDDLSLLEIK